MMNHSTDVDTFLQTHMPINKHFSRKKNNLSLFIFESVKAKASIS